MKTLLLALAILAPLESFDAWVQQRVQASRSPALEGAMRFATRIGTPTVVFGSLLGIAVFDPAGIPVARHALLTLAPANLVVEVAKRVFQRPRPDGDRQPANSSFPSSHAANAFAVAAVFARRWRRAGAVFWLAASVIAVSRVYLNRHYATDVIVGAAVGIVMAALAARWGARWITGNGRVAPGTRAESGTEDSPVAAG